MISLKGFPPGTQRSVSAELILDVDLCVYAMIT